MRAIHRLLQLRALVKSLECSKRIKAGEVIVNAGCRVEGGSPWRL